MSTKSVHFYYIFLVIENIYSPPKSNNQIQTATRNHHQS